MFLSLSILALCACKAQTQAPAPTPLTTITAPQGGKIVYGAVSGATTQSAVLTSLLARVHSLCGEKPQIGRVFQFTGTNSVGVFFTVTDHPEGNLPLAGMVIARSTGPNQADGAMIYDLASRFGQTVNPMLQQLSSVWQPGGQAAASGAGAAPAAGGSAPAASSNAPSPAGAASASSVPLHPITAPDNSATISVPAGWSMDPASRMGELSLQGANGEQMGLLLTKPAADPSNPWQMRMAAAHYSVILPGSVVYAFRGDPVKEFVPLFQAWRKANGKGPAQIVVKSSQSMPTNPGNHCAGASGQMDLDGKGMQSFTGEICANDPNPQYGNYAVSLTLILIPLSLGDTEKGLMNTIIGSYKPNQQVIGQEENQLLQAKQQSDQQTLAAAQARVNQIKQTGAQATARFNATEAANSAEQSSWEAGQNANAQNNQGFSNYLLDQSVVQNNSTGAHATLWNNAADGLVQSNPNKYSYVSNPNLIPGTDY